MRQMMYMFTACHRWSKSESSCEIWPQQRVNSMTSLYISLLYAGNYIISRIRPTWESPVFAWVLPSFKCLIRVRKIIILPFFNWTDASVESKLQFQVFQTNLMLFCQDVYFIIRSWESFLVNYIMHKEQGCLPKHMHHMIMSLPFYV